MLMDMAIYIKPTYELVVLSMWPLLSCSIHLMDVYYQNIPLLDGLSDGIAKLYILNAGSHVYLSRGYPDDEMDGYIPDHDRLCTGRKIRYKIKNLQ